MACKEGQFDVVEVFFFNLTTSLCPFSQAIIKHFAFESFDHDISSQFSPSFRNLQAIDQSRSIETLKDLFSNMWNSKIDNKLGHSLQQQ